MKHNDSEQFPVIQLVDAVICKAIERRTSDIHCEPTEQGLRIRYRIDGVLYDAELIALAKMAHFLARLKVLANLDITERRIPHDGKFMVMHAGYPIDIRVSTFPSVCGEHIVIRILDRSRAFLTLEQLGLNEAMQKACAKLFAQSSGFFLVTGPTGSGKTTTLYAALAAINDPGKHVITLEDPVEYQVPGVTQGQIQTEAGFTFEKGMRAILRQDPDIIMVGEIRDIQTARIAIQAALTGHLVLSTLHTIDAASVIVRLIDMGIEPFLITAALTGVIAQRLARSLCSECRYERVPTAEENQILERFKVKLDHVYTAPGCQACFGLGYKGRVGIFELLVMTPELRCLIIKNASADTLRACLAAQAMKTLIDDGIDKVRRGMLSVHECVRVVL